MSILSAFVSNYKILPTRVAWVHIGVKMLIYILLIFILKGAAADCIEWLKNQICDLQIISQIEYAFMTSG